MRARILFAVLLAVAMMGGGIPLIPLKGEIKTPPFREAGRVSLSVSLLTCGPGPEIYEYYGHSALRVTSTDSAALDVVFNYGVFDFNSGNFALRFALGHTDYVCAMQQTVDFVEHYRRKGIYIDEQVLNLTQGEARRLLDALLQNCLPENCVYRYNFFFDNCATRVRDKIEENIGGRLRYPERPVERSLRDAVHFYSHNYRWATFGQDLLLGREADVPATGRELQFAPLIMEQDFAQTLIADQLGVVHYFAGEKHRLLDLPPIVVRPSVLLSPLAVAVYLLVAVLILGIVEWRRGKIIWPADSVLLLAQGLGGIIVAFLYFFSTHPTVGSNALVWVLNPLPLVGMYWQIKGGRKGRYWYYHAVALAVLAVFMLAMPAIPQYISAATKLMLLVLLLRSLTNVLVFLKGRKFARSQGLKVSKSQSLKVKPQTSNFESSRVRELTIICSLFSIVSYVPTALAGGRVPRLVVNVAIDGLRSDLLDAFFPLYGNNGLRLLMTQGRVFSNAECPNDNPDRASSIATIATGAVPYDHGIIGRQWLNRSTLRPTFCVEDEAVAGLNTTERLSPASMSVSTVGDELKVASEGKALVYSFAPTGDAAVLGAGHAADGALWLDRLSGLWAGTTYYSAQLPAWVQAVNGRVDPAEGINERVVELARSCLRYTTMGVDEIPDYLAVSLSVAAGDAEGAYMDIDRAVGNLIDAAESEVGKGNVLFVFTSTGTAEEETADLGAYRIPTGNFYIDRTANLLNMMLMAVYGQGNYVEAVFDNQIYLNHKLIEQKQLNMGEVLDRCQELLLQSEGVKDAYSAQRLLQGAWTPGIGKLRNGYNPRLSGDIVVQVAPGWHLVNETSGYKKLVRESFVNFPIIFYGLDVPSGVVETPVSTDCIAATLASVMRIRAPNACRNKALPIFGAAAQ